MRTPESKTAKGGTTPIAAIVSIGNLKQEEKYLATEAKASLSLLLKAQWLCRLACLNPFLRDIASTRLGELIALHDVITGGRR